MATNYANIIETATSLQANSNKLELVSMARALGWRGDHARAPVLQLALFIASKLSDGAEMPATHDNTQHAPQGNDKAQGQQDAPDAAQGQQDAPDAAQGQQDAPDAAQGQQDAPDAAQGQQDNDPEPEQEYEAPDPDEFAQLLKASGIKTPHKLLHKAWLITAKARQNLMLVGPAGCGKTMLVEQLSILMKLPFASVSCTMGMSESQLTGWLLPVGKDGAFSYVESPFVKCLGQPSVFLLDEMDAADANVLMILNSALANGFISIPHKLDNPMVRRNPENIIVAAVNTMGGADDVYSARSLPDGSTLDRFYTLRIDYDKAYERNLFSLDKKTVKRSVKWKPTGVKPDQFYMDTLADTFEAVRTKTEKTGLSKIISTRFAHKMIAASMVGIPLDEIKADLFIGWSDDEMVRIGMKG